MMRGRVTARNLSARLKELEPDRELHITVCQPEDNDSAWTWRLSACAPHEVLWEYYGWVSGGTYQPRPAPEPLEGKVTANALIAVLEQRDPEILLALTGGRECKLVETRGADAQPRPSARPLWRV